MVCGENYWENIKSNEIKSEEPVEVKEEEEPTEVETDQPTEVKTENPAEVKTEKPAEVKTEKPAEVKNEEQAPIKKEQPREIKKEDSNLERSVDSVLEQSKVVAKRNSATKQFELSTKLCGSKKSCYVSPKTCDTAPETCEYVLSWDFDGELINYQLTALSKGWTGVLFSKDNVLVRKLHLKYSSPFKELT